MFKNKKENKTTSVLEISSSETKLDKQKIITEIDKQVIRTMQKDLNNFDLNGNAEPEPVVFKKETVQRTVAKSIAPAPEKKDVKIEIPPQIQIEGEKDDGEGSGKFIATVISLVVIIMLVAGGYYFWSTRMDDAISNIKKDKNQVAPITQSTFSKDKANYLSVDMPATDAVGLKKVIMEYADNVSMMNPAEPIEFVVTDSSNSPVSFQIFAQKIGIALSPTVMAQLNEAFSLYVYMDNAQAHLGLSIEAKDPVELKKALADEELGIIPKLAPIFLETSIMPVGQSLFNSSTYAETAIRYSNLPIETANFSIDYAIANGKLVIGTSKMTARKIIDALQMAPILTPGE